MESENNQLRLVEVGIKNFNDLIDLAPFESQNSFVADNIYSLAEAYANISDGRYAKPFGIYDGDEPVGFLMIGFDKDDYWEDAPAIAAGSYNFWRLMIDKNYQGRGYGREAVRLALEFIKTFPCGKAEFCWLSYEPENETARRLYREYGFEETGEMDGEEVIAVLRLQDLPSASNA